MPTMWKVCREVTGPLLTLATAFSLVRVFEGDDWVVPVVVAAGVGHLLAAAVRRLGWNMLVSALVSGVGLILTVTWTHYWDTTAWGLPAGQAWSALADDMDQAWAGFGDLSPPVTPLDGFTISAMAAVWLLAFLNDWAAMRDRNLLEPILLPVLAFGFVGLVGDERHRMLTIGVFTASLLLMVTVHRVAARTVDAPWLEGESRASSGRRSLVAGSAAMAAVALGGAVMAGPVLGSNEAPLVDLTEVAERAQKPSGRVVISPLVDIRGRLVNQAETVMFRVRADERSFWRLTALDQFDGRVWTSRADYAESPSQLPSLFQSGTSVEQSFQEFRIEQLAAVWLPAAFEPRYLDSATTDISYEPSSSTLIVGRSLASSNGIAYRVASALPRFDPEALKAIPAGVGLSADLAPYTELPTDFSPRVQALAADLTAGAESGYEQALALQSFFRSGEFTYDVAAPSGHSGSRIEDFLDAQRGYCEQFAGTFAAMARSLGLPARVAVGFTVGEADPDNPGLYIVRGKHAHAWPEVFLPGAGWVAFEPTPGRGAPGAQNYTGVVEAQETGDPAMLPVEEAPAVDPGGAPDTPVDFEALAAAELPNLGETQTAAVGDSGGMTWRTWLAILLPSAAALLILLIPWLKHFQRRRRLRKAGGNRGRIRLLWDEALGSLALIDFAPRRDETHDEFARRAIEQVPLHSPDLRQLGELAAAATFAPAEPTDRHQWLARTWSMSVRSEVDFRVGWRQRLVAAFDPRPLFRKVRGTRKVGRVRRARRV